MGFKDNLLKKIDVDRLARRVIRSLKTSENGSRVDKQAMRDLLARGGFSARRERDLELYILTDDGEKQKILVLDNGLAIYHTTIADVCLRKSPTIREMVSIRNAIRILSDRDVVISKKKDSVRSVQRMILAGLDMTCSPDDIDQIEKEGRASLENRYADGVMEALTLFAELLHFRPVPAVLEVPRHWIRGAVKTTGTGKPVWGPVAVYAAENNALRVIDGPVDPANGEQVDGFRQAINGHGETAAEGAAAFTFLKGMVPV